MTAVAAGGCAALLAQLAPLRFESATFELPAPVAGLAALDCDGDGRQELLVARDSGLELCALPEGGATGLRSLARLDRGDARTLAWCIGRAPGEAPRHDAVYLARDDGAILRWELGRDPVEIARTPTLLLPGGVLSFPFARDLDGDAQADLALPEPAGLRLWFSNPDGSLRKGPRVRHRVQADVDLPTPEDGRPEVAVSLSIPSFKVEDQNGDGFRDLAFASEDRLQFFWSGAGGALPETPSFEIDVSELRQKLKSEATGLLDPTNLFKAVATLVRADVRDLDGDGLSDLLLQQGPKVSIFAGMPGGIERTKAAQVLKTSGNLIVAFSADDNHDGKLDLCMLQGADISIGEVLLWVVVGGELKLDLFTYYQEERLRFAKHPSRRRRIVIDVPAILGLASQMKENNSLKRVGEELARVPVALDLDGDGRRTDIAHLRRDGTVELHAGVAPEGSDDEEEVWRAVTERFDREAHGEQEVTVPLLGLVDWLPLVGGRRRTAIAGREPTQLVGSADAITHPDAKEPATTRRMLVVLDVDGDRRDDLLLVDPGDATHPVRLDVMKTR